MNPTGCERPLIMSYHKRLTNSTLRKGALFELSERESALCNELRADCNDYSKHTAVWAPVGITQRCLTSKTVRTIVIGAICAVSFGILGNHRDLGNVAFAQDDPIEHYEPFVLVDLTRAINQALDDASEAGEVEIGECLDVNDDGYACGYFVDDTLEEERGFFFSPLDGGSVTLLDDGGLDRFRAVALTTASTGDEDDIIIVGWGEDDTLFTDGPQAVYWINGSPNWDLEFINGWDHPNQEVSKALAISDEGWLTGYFMNNDNPARPRIFTFEATSTSNTPNTGVSSYNAQAYAIRDDDTDDWAVAGSFLTGSSLRGFYTKNTATGVNLHAELPTIPTGTYDESNVLDMNSDDDVVGWATYQVSSVDVFDPIYWWYDTVNEEWDARILQVDNPDTLSAGANGISERDTDGWVNIVGDYDDDDDDDRLGIFFIRHPEADDEDYWSYALNSTSGHEALTLFPHSARQGNTPVTHSGNGVNNNFWIAGSYSPEPPSSGAITDYLPALYIPNDFNNNGKADILEILDDNYLVGTPIVDRNSNWLIDWAENDQGEVDAAQNMRCGLHAPGFNGRNTTGGTSLLLVDNVQIVRHLMTYEGVAEPGSEPIDEVSPDRPPGGGTQENDEICDNCEDFHQQLLDWGTWDGTGDPDSGGHQREIVLTVRNPDTTQTDKDVIPTGTDREEKLALLRQFAFRFAYCVDYIQVGNESFSGAGEYLDDPDGTPFSELYGTAFTELLTDAKIWIIDQAEAVREGSALAGRPLRVIAPGFPLGIINKGADGELNGGIGETDDPANRVAITVNDIIMLANENRMFFDLHMHYLNVLQAEQAMDSLTKDDSPWYTAGNTPDLRMVLEFGPKGDPDNVDDWETVYRDEINLKYFKPTVDVNRSWEDFIKEVEGVGGGTVDGWEADQFQTAGFRMDSLLNDLLADNYVGVCFGPSLQRTADEKQVFNIASLKGSKIDETTYEKITHANKFTPVLTYTDSEGWEDLIAGADFWIVDFEPHCTDCDESDCDEAETCPGCQDP